MPRALTITCDHCGRDLTTTGNCEDYRVRLVSEGIPPRSGGGAVTLMAVSPLFPHDLYFCNGRCFWKWAEQKIVARR